ncbi:MAG: hypothetical protein M0P43_08835 [Arcobacteraceae bacterium]|nr:hypothetical protein [Arcobacteraceae bacterium]MDY0328190.1 hypothetical protein [Arcobacteraceae bacterium]
MKKNLILVFLVMFVFFGCSKKIETRISTPPSTPTMITEDDRNISIIQEGDEKTLEIKEPSIMMPLPKEIIIKKEKIAVVFASKVVGRYGNDAVNTIIAYSMLKEIDFEIKVYDTLHETQDNIEQAFNELKYLGFTKVIALFANDNSVLYIPNNSIKVYIPTLHKKNAPSFAGSNVIYGSIDYEEQFKQLLNFSNGNLSEIYNTDKISIIFNQFLRKNGLAVSSKYDVTNPTINYKNIFSTNTKLENSTLFINSTVLQTAIVLSQLRVYEINPQVILSTQLNYNPLILSLSQFEDRKSLLIANSIGKVHSKLKAISTLLGSDIEYNWVNFSTLVGMKELLFINDQNISGYTLQNNQILFDITIYKPAQYSFVEVSSPQQ